MSGGLLWSIMSMKNQRWVGSIGYKIMWSFVLLVWETYLVFFFFFMFFLFIFVLFLFFYHAFVNTLHLLIISGLKMRQNISRSITWSMTRWRGHQCIGPKLCDGSTIACHAKYVKLCRFCFYFCWQSLKKATDHAFSTMILSHDTWHVWDQGAHLRHSLVASATAACCCPGKGFWWCSSCQPCAPCLQRQVRNQFDA